MTKRGHDRLIEAGRELERLLADERARIDCSTRGGWLSEDLECAGEDGPACWKHLLEEAQGKLDAVEEMAVDWRGNPSKDDEWWLERLARILKGE